MGSGALIPVGKLGLILFLSQSLAVQAAEIKVIGSTGVASVVTEPQRSAFEAWKGRLEGAARKRREVTVWVLAPTGAIETRQVRLGLADDDFAEVVGDGLKEGDRVVLRSREAGKK